MEETVRAHNYSFQFRGSPRTSQTKLDNTGPRSSNDSQSPVQGPHFLRPT